MSSEKRKATEMIRVTELERTAINLRKTKEQAIQRRRFTDGEIIRLLFKRAHPEDLIEARKLLGIEKDTEDKE